MDSLGNPQSVLLVGGTSHIGLAIVARLGRDQHLQRVVLLGRDAPGMRTAAETLPADHTDVVVQDLTEPFHAESVIEQCGQVDVVILAAGILPAADENTDPTAVSRSALVNYVSQMVLGTAAVNAFQQQGRGVLVVLSSVAAERGRSDNYVYGSTKAGLDTWASGLADALATTSIRVLIVRAGKVRTRMSAHIADPPMTIDTATVADVVADNLVRGPVVVWVPGPLRWLMSGLRHTPRPIFSRIAAKR